MGVKLLTAAGDRLRPKATCRHVVALKAEQRVDEDLDDLLRGLGRHLLDVHAAGLARHDHDLGRWPGPGRCSDRAPCGCPAPAPPGPCAPRRPSGPVWWVTSVMPRIWLATRFHLIAAERASFTPPPLPRPPAWIWALTTTGQPPSPPATFSASIDAEGHPARRGSGIRYALEKLLGLVFVDFHEFPSELALAVHQVLYGLIGPIGPIYVLSDSLPHHASTSPFFTESPLLKLRAFTVPFAGAAGRFPSSWPRARRRSRPPSPCRRRS